MLPCSTLIIRSQIHSARLFGPARLFGTLEYIVFLTGEMEIAKKMIRAAKSAGADCVKFQKSNLTEKFTKSALERPYDSKNSFGKT